MPRRLAPTLILALLLVVLALPAVAQVAPTPAAPLLPIPGSSGGGTLSQGLMSNLPSGSQCAVEGKCDLCDMLQVIINVGNFILMIFGGVALLFLLWNSFQLITSRGADEKINEAKKGIWTTLGGVVIILIIWQIIGLVIVLLTNQPGPLANACSGGGVQGGTLANALKKDTIQGMLNVIIAAFPTIIGAVFFMGFVVSGFKWLTAAGEEEKIKEGMKGMLYAAIGLLVFLAAYVIIRYVIDSFTKSPRSFSLFPASTALALTEIPNPLTGSATLLDPPGEIYGRVVAMLLRFSGAIYFILMVYAGYLYMTASGQEEKMSKARTILIWATLAIVAMLSAFAVSAFILNAFNPGGAFITPQ